MNLAQLLESKPPETITYGELLSCEEWEVKRAVILQRDSEICTNCGKGQTHRFYNVHPPHWAPKGNNQGFGNAQVILHVHHKFYILSRLPWEYDNSALTTLCHQCHHELHEKETVPVYHTEQRTNGVKLDSCGRCGGQRIFPEYMHVQNGVCFQCGGSGMNIPVHLS